MFTAILGIMMLLAIGALVIGLISFGIWLLPIVVIGVIVVKVLKLIVKKSNKPDVVTMSRHEFETNYVRKPTEPAK